MEVGCEMLAMKEWLRESGQIRYSRCCVLDAPSNVPDGRYTVLFDGHCVSAVKQGGLWLPEDRVKRLPTGEPSHTPGDFSLEEILPLLKKEAA